VFAYSSLFFSALIAATILPAQSEALLLAMIRVDRYSLPLLLVFATAGNVAGSVLNWWLGRGVEKLAHRRWFPLSPARLATFIAWYRRYGRWTLLLSWAPIIGDPLTVAAGALREPFSSFVVLVTLAKLGRYLVVAWLAVNIA
jgi:membrane protein YqaA with SNARE-associated domain